MVHRYTPASAEESDHIGGLLVRLLCRRYACPVKPSIITNPWRTGLETAKEMLAEFKD